MKGFKKLALVTAVAALPMSGFAMEALDDATLSDVTGQTGIQIGLSLTQTMNVLIDDTDGLDVGTGPAAYTAAGGILIQNMGITGTATIDIDAGGNATDGVLVVQVALANGFNIDTGDLYAVDTTAGSGAYSSGNGANTPPTTAILDSVNVAFASGLDLEVQLGDGAANFAELTGDIGTLTITNFALNDIAGGGALSSTQIDISGLDVTGTTIALTATGMEIVTGASLNAVDITINDLILGGGAAMGDVYITGLDLSAQTITISGK
ncbi:DUF6160 family protein [Alcanivorax sp. 1008]|uniref:DUF6160 family protein n=1 Tax=Alcanivorax sp. 1008 TaxID=2816853 RepID=UPI001E0E3D17|nr:DUF6160 family protein [Alcanivorax sp. 1008]MCC1498258.1 hypothetical protein [Alcanivorax sp. 1008]